MIRMPFSEAAVRFLADRVPHLAPRSIRTEKERGRILNRTFGTIPVSRITPEDVLHYVRRRKSEGIANATINRELDILRGVLKKTKRWHLFADEVHPLPVRQTIGRALAYDEKVRLLKIASSRPEWQNAAWAATLALNTTMRGCEIKQLRWRDVDFIERILAIRKSKTETGERVIPINIDAWNAVLSLYRRAQQLGSAQPEHYVFPACEVSHFDPTRPQTSWRTAWRSLTRAIQCPACGQLQSPAANCCNRGCKADMQGIRSPIAGLRFHDLRHHAITELAEPQASDATVMAIAGHVSPKMLQHYSHVRLQAKRSALDVLVTRRADGNRNEGRGGGYDTNSDTNPHLMEGMPPQVLESMVELTGIEPVASSLRTRRSPS